MDSRLSVFRSPRSRSPRLSAALLGLLVLPLAAACSSSGSSGSSTSAAAPSASSSAASSASAGASSSAAVPATGSQIVIDNFKFSPAALTVKAGQKVTVMNKDSTAHTATASAGKAFDTGDIAPGASATFTAPTKPGSYPYICSIHQFMHAVLTVQ
jgi:plastocyanin